MTEVNVETLEDELGDYLARARSGEKILFTERGRSIAVLIPIEDSPVSRRAWKLVESGVAHWSGGKPKGSRQRPKIKGMMVSEMVLEDRR